MNYLLSLAVVFVTLALPATVMADWDYSKQNIDTEQIQSGGPPRDGIPALFQPKTPPAWWVNFLDNDDQDLEVVHNGIAGAYSTRIRSWHELVNDDFGDAPLLVSWWPLAFAGAVYSQ